MEQALEAGLGCAEELGLCSATFAHRHTHAHICTHTQRTHSHTRMHTSQENAHLHVQVGRAAKCSVGVPSISGLELEKAVTGWPPPAPALKETLWEARGASRQLDPRPRLEGLKHQTRGLAPRRQPLGTERTCEAWAASCLCA